MCKTTIKMSILISITKLVHKIIKTNKKTDLYKLRKQIELIILSHINQQILLVQALTDIKILLVRYNIHKYNDTQYFIADKLSSKIYNIIKSNSSKTDICICDIGGGNGNIISKIGTNLNILKNNLICIETKQDWYELYTYDHDNITYYFWDNNTIYLPNESVDFVIIMVSLHHMTDEIIQNTISEVSRILKTGGYLLLKEHDCITTNDNYIINWEHHLYHLMEIMETNKMETNKMETNKMETNNEISYETEIEKYVRQYVENFKSKEYFDTIITKYSLQKITELSRILEPINIDINNITKLYWAIYTK